MLKISKDEILDNNTGILDNNNEILDGGRTLEIKDIVDPNFDAPPGFFVDVHTPEYIKDLLSLAFVKTIAYCRITHLSDLKEMIRRLAKIFKQISKLETENIETEDIIIRGGEKKTQKNVIH